MLEQPKIGNIVLVCEVGHTYATYEEWAIKNELTRFKNNNKPKKGCKYKIIVIAPHALFNRDIYGIECLETKQQFIMDADGFVFCSKDEYMQQEFDF